MQGKCKRAFVIGLDGAIGWSVREAETPNIDAILSEGVVTYSAKTAIPTASFEAWGAMFHGVGPAKHQINDSHPILEDAPWPSFMKVAKQTRSETKCASFSCWAPINTHIIEPSCECHCVSMPDPQLALAAAEYIRAQPPDVYFMQLDFIDGAGHSHGYGSAKYLKQIKATDEHVGIVLEAIRDSGVFDESLIILLSDHGGVENSHGGDQPDCTTIFWGCRGAGITQGMELESSHQVNIIDTAAVVTYALGLPTPDEWDAKVPGDIFE